MKNNLIQEFEEDFVYEECSICHGELNKVEDIFVDVEKDTYVCKSCKSEYNLIAVPCVELGY